MLQPAMFANAFSIASQYTKPVIVSHVRANGQCAAGVGTFMVINEDGWILTAAHIFDQFQDLARQKADYQSRQQQKTAIAADKGLLDSQKKKRIKKLFDDIKPDSATDFSFWWGADGVTVKDAQGLPGADLAVARLDPFDATTITAYPVFKDASKPIANGTSLCRLGFPFHVIQPSYANGAFTLPPETFPMVFFPNEGILTRVLEVNPGGPVFTGFIETSSPGLRGQSGGPIFDQHGTVWGVQSHTTHLPLGFSPAVPGHNNQVEHQFLNVGRGAHPASIAGLLTQAGIKHATSAY